MKTVGILTWIHPINYGGVLQAYALRTTINKLKDCSAEIINFAPPGVKYMPYEDTKQGREQYRKKVEAFNRFRHEKCGISTPVASKVKDGVYDYYCAGSDQIWNPIYGYGNKEFYFLILRMRQSGLLMQQELEREQQKTCIAMRLCFGIMFLNLRLFLCESNIIQNSYVRHAR